MSNKFSLLILVTFLISKAYGNCGAICESCNDPPYNLTAQQVPAKYIELVPRIWEQKLKLTLLGQKYVNLIQDLSQDNNFDNVLLAIVSSVYINNFIPYMDMKPDACVMAAVINATLTCVVNQNQNPLQTALTDLKNRLFNINFDNMLTMILSSGCDFRCGKSPPDPKIKKTTCYKNGFVYPVKQLWDLYGAISPELKNLVLDLYKSTDFVDNFLAVCTTFTLAEPTQKVFNLWDPNIIFESIDLELSNPIITSCCYQRIKRADEVRKINDQNAINATDGAKQYYTTTQCKS